MFTAATITFPNGRHYLQYSNCGCAHCDSCLRSVSVVAEGQQRQSMSSLCGFANTAAGTLHSDFTETTTWINPGDPMDTTTAATSWTISPTVITLQNNLEVTGAACSAGTSSGGAPPGPPYTVAGSTEIAWGTELVEDTVANDAKTNAQGNSWFDGTAVAWWGLTDAVSAVEGATRTVAEYVDAQWRLALTIPDGWDLPPEDAVFQASYTIYREPFTESLDPEDFGVEEEGTHDLVYDSGRTWRSLDGWTDVPLPEKDERVYVVAQDGELCLDQYQADVDLTVDTL